MQKIVTLIIFSFFTTILSYAQPYINQQIWPRTVSDSVLSQFSDSTKLFWAKATTPNPPTGFVGWTTRGLTCAEPTKIDSARWEWKRNASPFGGAFFGSTSTPIASTTAANGAVVFNSDYLDNRGDANPNAAGLGPAPSPHSSELISPIIDVTGFGEVTLQFQQWYRPTVDTKTFVQWSQDSGRTWLPTNPIQINKEIGPSISTPNTKAGVVQTLRLRGSVGTSGFRVKFLFSGNYYYWVIDDVKLWKYQARDIKITDFFAHPTNILVPSDQQEEQVFLASLENIGTLPQRNTRLEVKVFNATTGTQVFSSVTNQYPNSFNPYELAEKRILPQKMPPLPIGKYRGYYRVFGDSIDHITANDTAHFHFWVTGNDTLSALKHNLQFQGGVGYSYFAKEDSVMGVFRPSVFLDGQPYRRNWRTGNVFRLTNPVGRKISTLAAYCNLTDCRGSIIYAHIYRWQDANNDGLVQLQERTLIATDKYNVPTTAGESWYIFNLKSMNGNSGYTATAADTNLLAMVAWNDIEPVTLPTKYFRVGYNLNNNFAAMRFATDSIDKPRYSIVFGYLDNDVWTTADLLTPYTPCVRLNHTHVFTKTAEILDDDYQINLSPNPITEGSVSIRLTMPKAQDIVLRVYALDGQLLDEFVFDGIAAVSESAFDVSRYANGTYLLQLQTNDGYKTVKFVVAK